MLEELFFGLAAQVWLISGVMTKLCPATSWEVVNLQKSVMVRPELDTDLRRKNSTRSNHPGHISQAK